MTSAHRIRFNRSLFSAELNGAGPRHIVMQLAAEDIDLIFDMRAEAGAEHAELDQLCEEMSIYYVARPPLGANGSAEHAENEVDEVQTWIAGLALRHRTCVLGDDNDRRLSVAGAIARTAGQRVIDLVSSPAPVAQREH